MNLAFVCGIFGVVMSSLGYIFQAYKIYCDKSGDNLSYFTFFFISLMNIAYVIYFISTNDLVGLLGAIIPLVLLVVNVWLKYYYSKKKKPVLIK